MKSWTVKEMLAEKPCNRYDEARITELWARRERLTLLEILELNIPDADKVWVGCRPDAFEKQHDWVMGIVDRAVRKYALPHEATRASANASAYAADAAYTAARAAAYAANASAYAAARAARAAAAYAAEHAQQVSDLRKYLEASDENNHQSG